MALVAVTYGQPLPHLARNRSRCIQKGCCENLLVEDGVDEKDRSSINYMAERAMRFWDQVGAIRDEFELYTFHNGLT